MSSDHHFANTNPKNNSAMKTTKHVVLRVQDKPTFGTIDEICKATGVDPRSVHRGYLRKPGAPLPSDPGIDLWWPSADNKNWDNHLSEDGLTLWSKSRKEPFSIAGVIAAANAGRRTAVFFREPLLGKGYQFVGVFKTNLEKSRKRLFHVFDRVSDELEV